MVHLDDLDIVVVAEPLRRDLYQPDEHVDADAHVGGGNDGNDAREAAHLFGVGDRESGRAHDRADLCIRARRQVGERRFRAGKVDQHVGTLNAGRDICRDRSRP